MLSDMMLELIDAMKQHDDQKKERIFKALERTGMDRRSVIVIAVEMMNQMEETE